jgi:hypothetical protein
MEAPQLLQGTGAPGVPVAGTHVPQRPQITSGKLTSFAAAGRWSQHWGGPEPGGATKRGESGSTRCSADASEEEVTATMAILRRGIAAPSRRLLRFFDVLLGCEREQHLAGSPGRPRRL